MKQLQLQRKELQSLAGKVIAQSLSSEKRVEEQWLNTHYQDFLKRNGIRSRADGDTLLCTRMMEQEDRQKTKVNTGALKIRYWRTGRHYPKNRTACEAFGHAMDLDEDDMRYLMTKWFNRADRCFDSEDTPDPEYIKRTDILKELKREFLDKQRPEELLAMCAPGTAPEENLRYIYCNHALRYLGSQAQTNVSELISHLDTRGYEYQFGREMNLIGDVSRSAMIRHLLILGMPFVSRERVNGWLDMLGYATLDKLHRQPGGMATDLLILGLLEEYEKTCTGRDPVWCTAWFCQAAGTLDDALEAAGCGAANPFRFKHIMGGKDV